jgi:4-alpha-glucanotransferase
MCERVRRRIVVPSKADGPPPGMIGTVTSSDAQTATDEWGIDVTWIDADEQVRAVLPDSLAVLRQTVGTPPPDLEDTGPLVTRPGLRVDRSTASTAGTGSAAQAVVECEDGAERAIDLRLPLPDDFPLGYHRLRARDGSRRRLIVSPGKCWLPEGWRAWGWALQLYATRSGRSWGIGDLGDLRSVREWSESLGAGFLLVNPMHAVSPTFPQEPSPYLPVTRRFRSPVYLRVADVPGADRSEVAGAVAAADRQGRALNNGSLINRDEAWRLKRDVLRRIFEAGADREAFGAWRADHGQPLEEFCRWMAIAIEHGGDWRTWDAPLRDPASTAVAQYASRHRDEVDFQAWLQWALDTQLRQATGDLTVLQDLPIGVDGGGADAWVWQDCLAQNATVGAPPDLYSTLGQDWGSPPFVPWRLQARDYEPFVQSIRATMAGAGGLRIDHVMGLFRLWWVPAGRAPAEGAYVRYPSADLLDIVALESHRLRAVVVGEDLGTVERGVRDTMDEQNLLSYRLLFFEQDPPRRWPAKSMAAVTTHDLPTIAGLWGDVDTDDRRRHTDETEAALAKQRDDLLAALVERGGIDPDLSADDAIVAAYELLTQTPSTLISATLDDAVAAERRPNIPGAVSRENWRIPLPVRVEDVATHPLALRIARTLRDGLKGPIREPNAPPNGQPPRANG